MTWARYGGGLLGRMVVLIGFAVFGLLGAGAAGASDWEKAHRYPYGTERASPADEKIILDAQAARDQGDMARSHALLLPLANAGVPEAIYQIGLDYFFGEPIAEDEQLYARMMARAARKGHLKAQYRMAEIFYHGHGVEIDKTASECWARIAAQRGYAPAQRRLGNLLYFRLVKDPSMKLKREMAEWLSRSQMQGYPHALFENGLTKLRGRIDTVDLARGYRDIVLAARAGHELANDYVSGIRNGDDAAKQYLLEWGAKMANDWRAIPESVTAIHDQGKLDCRLP